MLPMGLDADYIDRHPGMRWRRYCERFLLVAGGRTVL